MSIRKIKRNLWKLTIAALVIFLQKNSVFAEGWPECSRDNYPAPCKLEVKSKAPWAGVLLIEEDLAKLEAALVTLEKSVEILKKGLSDSEESCRISLDEMKKDYETRIQSYLDKMSGPPIVNIDTRNWWEPYAWGTVGAVIGGLIVGGVWLGKSL